MRFGLGLPTAFPNGALSLEFLDLAERAEAAGYASLWAGDHVVFHIPRYEIFTLLAAVAARTRTIRFGPGVLLLCLRNPAQVAQAMTTLDHLSKGRVIFGVGVGGEHPKEFAASGVPVRERGSRTDEALEIVTRLWSEPSLAFEGKHYRFDEISMKPAPIQKPHPPIWVGGRSDAALRRTVRYGNAWFPGYVTPDMYRERWAAIEALCRAGGRRAGEIDRALYLFVNVDRDPNRAKHEAAAFLSGNYDMPFKPFERYVVTGTPEDCVPQVREYVAAGAEHIVLRFASFEPARQLDLWNREVLPALPRPEESGRDRGRL